MKVHEIVLIPPCSFQIIMWKYQNTKYPLLFFYAGRGKMRIFKHVKTNKTYEEAFCWLGQTWNVSAELFQKLQESTSHMYNIPSTDATNVNDLRYNYPARAA